MRDLTTLENVLLAQLWHMGESTPHEIRKTFAASSSGRYSDSAGSIYPTLKRLEAFGLAASRADKRGRQARRLYRTTKASEAAIRKWLFALEPKETFPDDPIRTRFLYLALLDRKGQMQWFKDADDTLEKQAALMRDEYAAPGLDTPIDQLVLEEVLATIELRRERLTIARRALECGIRLTRASGGK